MMMLPGLGLARLGHSLVEYRRIQALPAAHLY